jgi:flagellar protein FliO/FliZ
MTGYSILFLTALSASPLFGNSTSSLSGGADVKAPTTLPSEVEKNSSDTINPDARRENADASIKSILTLGSVTTEVDGDLTIVTARLNKTPEWKATEIEEHGTFIQIKMPRTLIPSSGEFLDGNGPFLRKIASFQLGDEDGALRLFLNQDAAKAKMATSAELLGDRIIITIDHKKLEQLINPVATAAAQNFDSSSISNNIESEAPVSETQNSESPATSAASDPVIANSTNLHEKLTQGAVLCGVLFLALLGFQLIRNRKFKLKTKQAQNQYLEPVTMRVLSSISLGQKQKLTLVQVGKQQILLGLTPDSINLLSTIDNPSSVNNFSKALESADPNADVRLKNPLELNNVSGQKRLTSHTVNSRSIGPKRSSHINVAVGDDGLVDTRPPKTEDDITKILRDRLRNLPPG